ncbi:MAG: hypothetical protein AAF358_13855 [Pseudomonadota bacterium]
MSLFSFPEEITAPIGSRQRLSQVKASWGFIPRLHAILAERPVSPQEEDLCWHDPLGSTQRQQEEPAR